MFSNYFCTNRDIDGRETRNVDALYAPYGRLYVRISSIKIHGSDRWDTLPAYVHNWDSINVFKIRLRNHLFDRKVFIWCEKFTCWGFLNILINLIFLNYNFFIKFPQDFSRETGHYLNQWWPPKNYHTTWNTQWVVWNQYKLLCIYALKYVTISFHLVKPRLYLPCGVIFLGLSFSYLKRSVFLKYCPAQCFVCIFVCARVLTSWC